MDRYDVVLQAVDERLDRRQAVYVASVVLELDRRELERATTSLPAKVLEDVDERSAELLLGPLQQAGWRVRLVKRPPARRAPPSARPEALEPAVSPHPTATETPYGHPASPAGLAPLASSPWPGGSSGAHGELQGGAALLPLPELELDLPPAPARSAHAAGHSPHGSLDPSAGSPAVETHAAPRATTSPEPAAEALPEGETIVEFFASLPRTLLVPVRGGATKWLLLSLLLAIAMIVLSVGALGISLTRSLVGLGGVALFAIGASAFWIGHLFAYFRACLWAVIGGEEGPDAPSGLDGDAMYARVFDGLVVVFAFAVVNVGLVFSGGVDSPGELGNRFTIANALLGMHSPIGLALMAVRQTRGSYFDLITAVKLLVTAPIHMVVVLTLSFALSHLTTLIFGALTASLGASVEAGNLGVLWVGVPGSLLVGLALTLLQWGVLGAVMGAVCRARPGLVA